MPKKKKPELLWTRSDLFFGPNGVSQISGPAPLIAAPGRAPSPKDSQTPQESSSGPRDKSLLALFEYCTRCAATFSEFPSSVGEEVVEVTASIEGREYTAKKTIKELAIDAETRGEH
jgi:hypothetical protein